MSDPGMAFNQLLDTMLSGNSTIIRDHIATIEEQRDEALLKLQACEKQRDEWKAYADAGLQNSVSLQAEVASYASRLGEQAKMIEALAADRSEWMERAEANRPKGDGGHSRRCAQCDHWAVVDRCTICGAEEETNGAGISVEAGLAKDLYAAQCRLRTLAIGIVGARMAHAEEDYAEAYHLLYSAAKTLSDDPFEPWKALDALADGAIERRDGQTFVSFTAVERQEIKS